MALYVSMTVIRIGFGTMIIIFPSYILHLSDISSAVTIALYPIFEAAFALPAGRICDTHSRKNILTFSLGLMSFLTLLLGFNRTSIYVALVHGLMGICAAGVTVSSLALITDLTQEKNRGAGMGTFDFTNTLGYALGLFLGGRLETIFHDKLSYAFFVTATGIFATFILALALIKEPNRIRDDEISLNPLKSLDRFSRSILPLWFGITVLIGMVFFLPRAFSLAGIESSSTSLVLLTGVLILGAGSVGFGVLSDKIGRKKVIAIGIVGLSGLLTELVIITRENLDLLRFIPAIAPFAIATSALVPSILAIVGDSAKINMRGTAMGLYSVMLSGGIGIGTIIAGIAHSLGGIPGLIYIGLAIFLLSCIVSFILTKIQKS